MSIKFRYILNINNLNKIYIKFFNTNLYLFAISEFAHLVV